MSLQQQMLELWNIHLISKNFSIIKEHGLIKNRILRPCP